MTPEEYAKKYLKKPVEEAHLVPPYTKIHLTDS